MGTKKGGTGGSTCMMHPVEEEGGGKGSITIVLKVDFHCDGCTARIKNSVKGVPGLERVKVDAANAKLTVIGQALDPMWIRDRVASKTKKTVELISPVPKKKAETNKDKDDKKPKEPTVSTVVLKIHLHCDGCTQRIRKKILKIDGVASVTLDRHQDLVTVRGIMEPKALPLILSEKFKRAVEIVQPKKKMKKEEKDENDEGEGDKKGEKKKKKNEEEGCGPPYYFPYPYIQPQGYYVEMVHAPQIFSDENPNNCSVM